ncbi:UDP-2,3-diacylglucosamine diphosphatase, partial [bacterium]
MSNYSFFISDAHLGAESPDKENYKRKKLDQFFKIVKEHRASNIFILGDFFDFWFDYKNVIYSEYFDVLCQLRELFLNGVKIHFFGGNHDWWMSSSGFFANQLNANIY